MRKGIEEVCSLPEKMELFVEWGLDWGLRSPTFPKVALSIHSLPPIFLLISHNFISTSHSIEIILSKFTLKLLNQVFDPDLMLKFSSPPAPMRPHRPSPSFSLSAASC